MSSNIFSADAIRTRRQHEHGWVNKLAQITTPPSPAPQNTAITVPQANVTVLSRSPTKKPTPATTPTRPNDTTSWCRSFFFFGCEAFMMCMITALALIYVFVFVGYKPYGHSSSRVTHADGTKVGYRTPTAQRVTVGYPRGRINPCQRGRRGNVVEDPEACRHRFCE